MMTMMMRVEPSKNLKDKPCSVCAISTAYYESGAGKCFPNGFELSLFSFMKSDVRQDGYCSLKSANRFIRSVLDVQKYVYFKKSDRITFAQLSTPLGCSADAALKFKAIVCVLGHYIYVDFAQNKYWSFFDNLNDDVVAVWVLK